MSRLSSLKKMCFFYKRFICTNTSAVPGVFGKLVPQFRCCSAVIVDSDLSLGVTSIKLSFERKLHLVTSLIIIRSLIYCGARP